MALLIPVSWGELLDKITILEIKSARITDATKLENIRTELNLLTEVAAQEDNTALVEVTGRLRKVNEILWDIEDAIRECESKKDFGPRFVELARSVYKSNDQRAALKLQINQLLGSDLVEEKSYKTY